jgi:hypothetical protein
MGFRAIRTDDVLILHRCSDVVHDNNIILHDCDYFPSINTEVLHEVLVLYCTAQKGSANYLNALNQKVIRKGKKKSLEMSLSKSVSMLLPRLTGLWGRKAIEINQNSASLVGARLVGEVCACLRCDCVAMPLMRCDATCYVVMLHSMRLIGERVRWVSITS